MSRAEGGAGIGLRLASFAVVLFLYVPLGVIALYAFTMQSTSFTFPPPGFTTRWFGVAFGRGDMWAALRLSLSVGAVTTVMALFLGSFLAAAVARTRFAGRDLLAFVVVLPIALPGIVTGIALRSTLTLAGFDFGFWTVVVGHTTFTIVIVYNNVVARLRRLSPNLVEASADLGASGFQTFRHVLFPNLATALLAGGILAFALSFDEIIVTTFTRGGDKTLPIWIFNELFRPRNRPVTNVVALLAMAFTFLPVLAAQLLARDPSERRSARGAAPMTATNPTGA
jgi:putative spermidine/putrescine transport system permease protein